MATAAALTDDQPVTLRDVIRALSDRQEHADDSVSAEERAHTAKLVFHSGICSLGPWETGVVADLDERLATGDLRGLSLYGWSGGNLLLAAFQRHASVQLGGCVLDQKALERFLRQAADAQAVAVVETIRKPGLNLALLSAVEAGHVRAAETALRRGARATTQSRDIVPHPVITLAAESGDTAMVALLLAYDAVVDPRRDGYDHTPLMHAAAHGHVDTVRLLIKHGAKHDTVTASGQTALFAAARRGHLEVIRALLDAGCAPDLHGDDAALRALSVAARGGHLDIIRLLLERGADPTLRARDGLTAAEVARTQDVRRALLEAEAAWTTRARAALAVAPARGGAMARCAAAIRALLPG